jgi:formate dehydrogenase iron-sulfur subunit
MVMDRRRFLKVSAAGLGAAVLDGACGLPSLAKENRLAMLYDNSKCVGCKACQMACKQWNKLGAVSSDPDAIYESPKGLSPQVWTLIKLANYPVNPQRNYLFMNVGCMHCGKPACAAVCPTAALKKQSNGLVTFDRVLCNGCGYCTQYCPFHIPQLEIMNRLTGAAKSSKCTFCQDRVANGLTPFCIQSCPAGALQWGDRQVMLDKAHSRVEELMTDFPQTNLYGEKEMGGLGRLYVLLAPPDAYGLPQDPQFPLGATLWKKVVQPAGQVVFGAVTLGVVGAFFVVRKRVHMEDVE